MYLDLNHNGILDLKVVMGNLSIENDKSGLRCPDGYEYVTILGYKYVYEYESEYVLAGETARQLP